MAQFESPRYLGLVMGQRLLVFSVWPGLQFAVPFEQLSETCRQSLTAVPRPGVELHADFDLVSIVVSAVPGTSAEGMVVRVTEKWLAGSLQWQKVHRIASQQTFGVGELHAKVDAMTGGIFCEFDTAPRDVTAPFVAVGLDLEALNLGRAAWYCQQELINPALWLPDLQRFRIAACGCRIFGAIAAEMSACKLLGRPMPSCAELAGLFTITDRLAEEVVRDVVLCGLDVVPANDPDHLCPNMGGFGALRRVLAARVLDAGADFGVWRNKLASLKLHIRGLRVGDREIESLTNVGQALIASRLLELAISPEALSVLIKREVGGARGYSPRNVGRLLSELTDPVTGEEFGTAV
jgi:hypothetical protein